MAEKMADEMFDLSFEGYSTKKLATLAGITEGDAIFLQSGSTKISDSKYFRMRETIRKILNKNSKYLSMNYYINQLSLNSTNVQKPEFYDGDLIRVHQASKNRELANISIWYASNILDEKTEESDSYKNSSQKSVHSKYTVLADDDLNFDIETDNQYQSGENELLYSTHIKGNSYVSVR